MGAYKQVTLYYFQAALQKVTDEKYHLLLDHHKNFYCTMYNAKAIIVSQKRRKSSLSS